jgi:hypothetical protein
MVLVLMAPNSYDSTLRIRKIGGLNASRWIFGGSGIYLWITIKLAEDSSKELKE